MLQTPSSVVLDVDEVPTSSFRRIFRHWRALFDKMNRPPCWSDFAIETLTDLLPDITLLSYDAISNSFVLKRIGISMSDYFDKVNAGCQLSSLKNGQELEEKMHRIRWLGSPQYFERFRIKDQQGGSGRLALLVLPLQSDNADHPDHFIVASHNRNGHNLLSAVS